MAERNLGFEAAMIVNDLDSMNMRIEQLQAHPKYTEAQMAVQRARECMNEGRAAVHEREMKQRKEFGLCRFWRENDSHNSAPAIPK